MARVRVTALLLGALISTPAAAASVASPPTLDCSLGFEGLRAFIQSIGGVRWNSEGESEVATLEAPDAWRTQIAFTRALHPGHPSVTIRTFRKQVTGVWTADSKGCGYGDPARFAELMAAMKATDTQLTNASRADVERANADRSPLSTP